ncbi:MAG: hypothetical protein HC898_09935 [Phycisphaerales bacterium]|nr:hypothetical protein [Phycisphaerales bacterium]
MAISAHTTLSIGLVAMVLTANGVSAAVTDNFDDNAQGSEWGTVFDDVTKLSLVEQNQRLEILASSPTSSTTDALYLSNGTNGFLLSTASDFEIEIDFFFSPAIATTSAGPGSRQGLVFGIGRDLPDGTDSAAVGVGFLDIGFGSFLASSAGQRIDDTETLFPMASPISAGTFKVTYTTLTDQLILNNGSVGVLLTNLSAPLGTRTKSM